MNNIYVAFSHKTATTLAEEGKEGPGKYTCDTTVTLPYPINLHGKGVALVEIDAYVYPQLNKGDDSCYYLCCDFVKPSIVQLEDGSTGMFPVVRRVMFNHKRKLEMEAVDGVRVAFRVSKAEEIFSKLIFQPTSREDIDSFRLYLMDGRGCVVSVDAFDLKCSLLAIPYHGT